MASSPFGRRVLPSDDSVGSFDEDLQSVMPSTKVLGSWGSALGQVRTVQVQPKLERRISVGTDLAFSGTYTGPKAASKPR